MGKDLGNDPSTLPSRRGLDITGIPFGRLTPLYPIKGKFAPDGSRMWLCSCACNPAVRCEASTHLLRNGHVRSCGCLVREKSPDLRGMTSGKLTVLYNTGVLSKQGYLWHCRCSCDAHTELDVPADYIVRGTAKSCGCAVRENSRIVNTKYTTELEKILAIRLSGMKTRCTNEKRNNYKNYGGRGIYVCDEWSTNPRSFIDWALKNGFRKGLTIDRIDNNGPYAPWNCRWVDDQAQSDNKRNSNLITVNGMSKSLRGWDSYLGYRKNYLSEMKKTVSEEELVSFIQSAVDAKPFNPESFGVAGAVTANPIPALVVPGSLTL